MEPALFRRSQLNPILGPTDSWWEARAVLNPGAALVGGRVAIVYRAVGADGLSRFGLAWSDDGEHVTARGELPFYEGALELPLAFRDSNNWCQVKAGGEGYAGRSASSAGLDDDEELTSVWALVGLKSYRRRMS